MLKELLRKFDPATIRVDVTKHEKLDKALYKLERMSEGMELADIAATPEVIDESIRSLQNNTLPRRKTSKLLAMGGLQRLYEATGNLSLVERFVRLIDQEGSAVLLRCLLIGYLRFADVEGGLPELLRKFLASRQQKLPRQWIRRVESYDLLGGKVGDKIVGLVLGDLEKPPREMLAEAGLRGVLESSGFSRLVFREVTRSLGLKTTPHRLNRFMEWVEIDGGKRILFENSILDYCIALLDPYINQDPPGNLKSRIHNFLIEHFGDPRLKNQNWNLVTEQQRAVINRWLTEESFELLLQIVNTSNDTQHWRDRKQFWGQYIDRGMISEAWVALGPRAAEVARIMQRRGDIANSVVFGRLHKENIDAFHSVIFMRIGNWVISEWTHSGKVRFYNQSTNEHTPKLYSQWYRPSIIRNDYHANMAFVHNGNWQASVRSYLASKVGVQLTSSPRRQQTAPTKPGITKLPPGMKLCRQCALPSLISEQDANGICAKCRGLRATTR